MCGSRRAGLPWPDSDRAAPGLSGHVTAEELYASYRAWWRIGPTRRDYPYAVAIHNGITRAVWQIDRAGWVSHQRPGEQVRWAFVGAPAPAEIQDAFFGSIGRRVPTRRPNGGHVFGPQSSIAYWPE